MDNIPKCLLNISPKWHDILCENDFNMITDRVFIKDTLESVDEESYFDDHQANLNDEDILDINNGMNCVVGEAFSIKGHSVDNYDGCDICQEYSMRFYRVFDYGEYDVSNDEMTMGDRNIDEAHGITIGYDEQSLKTNIKEFCEHIKDKHPTILRDNCA